MKKDTIVMLQLTNNNRVLGMYESEDDLQMHFSYAILMKENFENPFKLGKANFLLSEIAKMEEI